MTARSCVGHVAAVARSCAALIIVGSLFGQAMAQTTGGGAVPGATGGQSSLAILIVDREQVLRDSIPAQRLTQREQAERVALGQELDQLRADLEAEEAEIALIRESGARETFEARVRQFDQRVRAARQTSQQKGEALQNRFAAARRNLSAALDPIMSEVMTARGAVLILDARNVVAAQTGTNITQEVIALFNARADAVMTGVLPGVIKGLDDQ